MELRALGSKQKWKMGKESEESVLIGLFLGGLDLIGLGCNFGLGYCNVPAYERILGARIKSLAVRVIFFVVGGGSWIWGLFFFLYIHVHVHVHTPGHDQSFHVFSLYLSLAAPFCRD